METLEAIRNAAKNILMTYPHDEDGRVTSAVKEAEYISKLEQCLDGKFSFEIPKKRSWYDCKIDGIPINVKITDQKGPDDAWCKHAAIFTWGGKDINACTNWNFNKMWGYLNETKRIETRDPYTEYHYLAVYKETGEVLLKSIIDIHTYHSNPTNIMQIKWKDEWIHRDYVAPNRSEKMIELFKVVQSSALEKINSTKEFAYATIV